MYKKLDSCSDTLVPFHSPGVIRHKDSDWFVDILDPFRIFYGSLMVYVVSGHPIPAVNIFNDSMN